MALNASSAPGGENRKDNGMPKKTNAQPVVEEFPPVEILQPGTIVQLKSGGPKMTVKGQDTPGADVWCLWFAGKRLETGCFGVDTLTLIGNGKKKKTAK